MLDAITLMLVLIILWDVLLKTAAVYLDGQVKVVYALLQLIVFWVTLSYVLSVYSFHWVSMFFIGIGIKLLVYALAGIIVVILRSKA